jgi:ribosomal protein S6
VYVVVKKVKTLNKTKMPFYVALLKIKPSRIVTRHIYPTIPLIAKHTGKPSIQDLTSTTSNKPSTNITTSTKSNQLQQQQQKSVKSATTTTTSNPSGAAPVQIVTSKFLNFLKDGGALVRTVRYGGNRPLPIPIRVMGTTHYFADFTSVEFASNPTLIQDLLRKSKAEKDLLRVNIIRADDVLKRIMKMNGSTTTTSSSSSTTRGYVG